MSVVLRFVLLIVLSLAIPVYGFAGFAASQVPCPMTSGVGDDVGIDPGALAGNDETTDCCSDPVAFEETGQPCKSGQECPGVHAVHVPLLSVLTAVPVGSGEPPSFSVLPLSRSATSIWRPPAAL